MGGRGTARVGQDCGGFSQKEVADEEIPLRDEWSKRGFTRWRPRSIPFLFISSLLGVAKFVHFSKGAFGGFFF